MSAIQKLIDLAKDLSISGMGYDLELDERADAAAEELAQMRASDELRRVALADILKPARALANAYASNGNTNRQKKAWAELRTALAKAQL